MAEVQPVTAPTFAEIGQTGLRTSGGLIQEEFLARLQWPRAGIIYEEMSNNDPVITAISLCSRQLVRTASWDVVPAGSSALDLQKAEFLKSCMNDMSTTWSDLIDDLFSFLIYGFSYHEIVYKRREGPSRKASSYSRYNDGRIGWRKIPGRAQISLAGWDFREDGALRGMKQYAERGEVFIPIEKALLFRTTSSKGNPEGRSSLRGAYRPWYFKKHIEEIEGIGIERDLAGLPVLFSPEGLNIFNPVTPEEIAAKTAALKLVTSIKRDRNEGVILPHNWDLKLLASASNRQFDTSQIISRYDQRIAITQLADIVMLGADKVGSFALAKVKQGLLASALDAFVQSVLDTFNMHAIPRLFAYNTFPELERLPTLKAGSVVSPDLNELGNYISKLAGSKMPLFPDTELENVLRKAANLPELGEADENRLLAVERSNTATQATESAPMKGGE